MSWTVPQEWLKRTRSFKSAQIYVAGTDLLLITNYSGADPNVNGVTPGTGGVGGTGFDYGTLSTPRVFSFGLTVAF